MLVSRIITALFLLPLAIVGILYLSTSYFTMVVSVIFVIAAYEWTKISIIKPFYNGVFIASIICLMCLLWTFCFDGAYQLRSIIFISVLFWILSVFFISQFPRYQSLWSTNLMVKYIVGYVLLIPSWYALILLKDLNLI